MSALRCLHDDNIDEEISDRAWNSALAARLPEIAIVGAGASAVCLLDALARAASAPGEVRVFDGSRHLWRGRAYQPDANTVRVNAPPADMSVRFGDPGHFERWLEARKLITGGGDDYADPYSGATFVPRALFGDYLEQSARASLTRLLDRGWQVEIVREQVNSAVPSGDGVSLRTASGARYRADYVVHCVGGGGPQDSYGLEGSPGFVRDPYPVSSSFADIETEHDVAVIGSGLTAVDTVLALAARGHRGRINMVSRSGVLPAVRQRPIEYTLRHFTPARFRAVAARDKTVTLDELVRIMGEELETAGESLSTVVAEVGALERETPAGRLRRQFGEVGSSSIALRILQQAVPDTGPDVWPLLPEQEKSRLRQEHYRTVMTLCCPMAPSSAAKLLELTGTGQLEIVGDLRHVQAREGGGFSVTAQQDRRVDAVVNAVNAPAHKIPPKAQRLIDSLVSADVAVPHHRGGVHVERATSRLTVRGKAHPRFYALGDLAAGSLFFTFGMPSLVDRAYDITRSLLRHAAVSAASNRQSVA